MTGFSLLNVRLFSFVQPSKALLPMLSTVEGIVMLVAEQFLNAPAAIPITLYVFPSPGLIELGSVTFPERAPVP